MAEWEPMPVTGKIACALSDHEVDVGPTATWMHDNGSMACEPCLTEHLGFDPRDLIQSSEPEVLARYEGGTATQKIEEGLAELRRIGAGEPPLVNREAHAPEATLTTWLLADVRRRVNIKGCNRRPSLTWSVELIDGVQTPTAKAYGQSHSLGAAIERALKNLGVGDDAKESTDG